MRNRRPLILAAGLALALIAMILLGRMAYQLGPKIAYADIGDSFYGAPSSQTNFYSAYTGACDNDFWSDGFEQCDAYGFTNSDYLVTGIRLYGLQCDSASVASMPFQVRIRLNSTGEILSESAPVLVNCVSSPPTGSMTAYTDFALYDAVQLDLGTTYALDWGTQDFYNGYNAWVSGTGGLGSFTEFYNTELAGGGPTISMYFPGDSTASSSIPEFRNWLVDGTNLDPNGLIEVNYALNLDDLPALFGEVYPPESYRDVKSGGLTDRNVIEKGTQLWVPQLPTSTTWYAWAWYISNDAQTYATSSIQQFTINPNGSVGAFASSTSVGFYHAFFSTSTTAGVAVCNNSTGGFLDDPVGNIVDAMCSAFNPDPVALRSYSQLSTDLSSKPPFGYFTALRAGLDGVATGTTEIAFMDASTTAAFGDIFTPIRTGFGVIIYLIGGVWLWNRARHLDI